LQGMCEASHLEAEIRFDAIPTMCGAPELAEAGVRSTIFDDNAALLPGIGTAGARALLFDPQTSGGLLAAVPSDQSERLLDQLRN
ncbi:AIR synthase-related protein, partial [Pseudomonas sp. SIMBA_044]